MAARRFPPSRSVEEQSACFDSFLAAQLSNAVLAAQAFQHDADLLFSGMMPACGWTVIAQQPWPMQNLDLVQT